LRRERSSPPRELRPDVTVIVPAFNEAQSVADTIRSLRTQTIPPEEIVVVDDCSDDGTGEVASLAGATVVRPSTNTGSKAAAQTYALPRVRTALTMAVDADTVLAPDAIEKLLSAFSRPGVAAACGFVVPRRVKSVWERGRYVEYMFAFTFFKPVQDYFRKPLISSGCFSMYRTDPLRQLGGWSARTLAEDMDLTWGFYHAGWEVRFVPEAVCYPIEPVSYELLSRQLRRWSHGFLQNVKLHFRRMSGVKYLRSVLAVVLWDAAVAPLVYFCVLPLLAALASPTYLLGYVIDAPAVLVPVVSGAIARKEIVRALCSFPAFFLLRLVNGAHMWRAMWFELVLRRRLVVYEKGH
jgi:biofilm PGA synthesis N-glycosyltransferase PgaC